MRGTVAGEGEGRGRRGEGGRVRRKAKGWMKRREEKQGCVCERVFIDDQQVTESR
jgi:hypothetical protein